MYRFISYCLLSLYFIACQKSNPNKNSHVESVISDQHEEINPSQYGYFDTVYVPIYSDIYSRNRDQTIYLTATLSIRNTNFEDTVFIGGIEYYDTKGALVRKYIDNPIYLRPMESIDYVIGEQDNEGGTGANFIITWFASNPGVKPIFQAIMIGSNGQQGMAFSADGISIKREANIHTPRTTHTLDSVKN